MYIKLIRWVPRAFLLLPLFGLIIMGVIWTGPSVRVLISPSDTVVANVSDKTVLRPNTEGERNPGSRDVYRTVFSTGQGPVLSRTRSVYDDLVIGDEVELDIATSVDQITAIRQDGEQVYRRNLWWPIAVFLPIATLIMIAAAGASWLARWMLRRGAQQQAWGDANIWDPPRNSDSSYRNS